MDTSIKGKPCELRGYVPRAYVLETQVTHARLLPPASKHSFVYTTVFMLLSLDALERHELDLLRGWLFSYGGTWGRVTGLRSLAYLLDNPQGRTWSIRQKLQAALDERGFPGSELRDAWLMTMPSFLGYEGINPLTVYFCYRHGETALWLVVLEVHNTFGERHIDVLKVGEHEEFHIKSGFDHQWKFPRRFHVSPFNDRSGHYICQLTAPSHPPFHSDDSEGIPHSPPRPVVKITLLTAPPHPQTKLIAILRTRHSTPLSSMSLLTSLARAPFCLLLSFPRILYQAFLLHYSKRLAVYQRPEPCAPDASIEARLPTVSNAAHPADDPIGGGIGWQSEGFFEAWCKRSVYTFLRTRCKDTGTSVTFISSNPFEGRYTIAPPEISNPETTENTLLIYYRTPRLFTILFTMPSPEHALLFGEQAERVFSTSSKELFIATFTPSLPRTELTALGYMIWRIRKALVPVELDLPLPSQHALDNPIGFVSLFILSMLFFLPKFERWVYKTLKVRFVPGDEPWGGWERMGSNTPVSHRGFGELTTGI